jgi:hypothetical protein
MAEDMLTQAQSRPDSRDEDLTRARRYEPPGRAPRASAQPSLGVEITRTVVKQLGTRQGQRLVRGILGSLFKGR